ncbi:CoB--CoM heterodisulfide reductase iron-sulfur subunit A family protein [bacterium]|nr:CoB--CoM heterodisulfide reductase iron-sulfur subunit A family protein [bacterium]
MAERTGVFICRCGPNIGNSIDVNAVMQEVGRMEEVEFVTDHNLLCSQEGKAFVTEQIKKNNLDRVVIAACTPKQYEQLFMNACRDAGINPFLMQMTNIREQCAWVTADRQEATEKALGFIKAAVSRVKLHESMEKKAIDASPDVLVVGGGVAGLESVLTLAQKGRKVYLVEKTPFIGGVGALLEDVYQTMECAPCMLAPELQEVLQKDNVEVYTHSELEDVVGSYGNFTVKIRKKARYVDIEACIGCNACFDPCPVDVPNLYDQGLSNRKAIYLPFMGALPNVPVIDSEHCMQLYGEECRLCEQACAFGAIRFDDHDEIVEKKVGAIVLATGADLMDPRSIPQYGYGRYENIYSAMELERLYASNGPTGGNIIMKNGKKPESVAFIYCVGRKEKGYCSGICCMYSVKLARHVQEKLPEARVYSLYDDLCLPKKESQVVYKKVKEEGIEFIRAGQSSTVTQAGDKLKVSYDSPIGRKEIIVDMVVLAPAMVPSGDILKLSELFDIPLDVYGFFEQEHLLMKPFGTPLEGVYIAGTCQGPKDIGDSVAQGGAAAGRILSRLVPGEKLELETKVANINEEICSGCRICIGMCPFSAISRDIEKSISVVDETLCRGCGTCSAACPTGAAIARHYTCEQILKEIEGVVQ